MKCLTYEELIAFAKKHYHEGGDGIVECWDENTYREWISLFGILTEKDAEMLIRV